MVYIGVTDFENSQQIREALEVIEKNGMLKLGVKLMAGVMMSYKTLNDIETGKGWENIWPHKEALEEVFVQDNSVWNTIHYADQVGKTSAYDLQRVVYYGGDKLDAVQLDMTWPDPFMIWEFAQENSFVKVILQVGKYAFKMADNDPGVLVDMLMTYEGALDYVLLDKSMGRGEVLDAEFLIPFISEIKGSLPGLKIAVAGGLGPSTIGVLELIYRKFGVVSIDAQGQMRSSGDARDPIEMYRVNKYLEGWSKLVQSFV